jgi:hypothetical protein
VSLVRPTTGSRTDSRVANGDRLGKPRPPRRRLKGVGKVLGLVRYQIVGELHDAYRVSGNAVVGDHDLAHPKVVTAPDPLDGEVALGRVTATLRLDL